MGDGDSIRFDAFVLDIADRRLLHAGRPVELAPRYFDALALLVRADGALVSKDRFLAEVWRGVPVTDEALTQCIRSLRRALGDDAAAPRFIRTVPKHGYRFVAPLGDALAPQPAREVPPSPRTAIALAGRGGGIAGAIGGLILGFGSAAQAGAGGGGSLVVVLTAVTAAVGLVGGAGIGAGIAAADRFGDARLPWRMAGGAVGGLATGGLVRLVGLDAFALLLGRAPSDITGAIEGAALGATAGLALALGSGRVRRGLALGLGLGAVAGAAIVAAGGRLMAGSLAMLAVRFPESRLRLDWLAALPPPAFGALEGALFCGCVVAALSLAVRRVLPATRGTPPLPPQDTPAA